VEAEVQADVIGNRELVKEAGRVDSDNVGSRVRRPAHFVT
jgi:hypothetical protein